MARSMGWSEGASRATTMSDSASEVRIAQLLVALA